jgi:hypothetical protein
LFASNNANTTNVFHCFQSLI